MLFLFNHGSISFVRGLLQFVTWHNIFSSQTEKFSDEHFLGCDGFLLNVVSFIMVIFPLKEPYCNLLTPPYDLLFKEESFLNSDEYYL